MAAEDPRGSAAARLRIVGVVAAMTLAVGGLTGGPAAAESTAAESAAVEDGSENVAPVARAALQGEAATIMGYINAKRAERGAPPLLADPALSAVAQALAHARAVEQRMYEDETLGTAANPLPGTMQPSFVTQYTFREDASSLDLFLGRYASRLASLDSRLTYVGLGWSRDGLGYGYLYLIAPYYPLRDVAPSDVFEPDIAWMVRNGVSRGYDDGTFRPRASVTREAMAFFLYRAWGGLAAPDLECVPTDVRRFSDVSASHPFCGEIEYLASMDVIRGWADGTFRPGLPVTREAAAAFLARTVVVQFPSPPGPCMYEAPFTDVPLSHPFCGEVTTLSREGLLRGWSDGTFRPGQLVERQAMAAWLHRAFGQ